LTRWPMGLPANLVCISSLGHINLLCGLKAKP
jgi:hypothetical protein